MKNRFFTGVFIACTFVALTALAGCSNPVVPSNPNSSPATYTVTFDGNAGGASVTNLPSALTGLSSGSKITSPTTSPALAGKVFGGWYKEAACTNVWNFDSDTVTANTTLYAKWVDSTATFTVTFNANAGTDTVSNMPATKTGVAAGSKITAPSETPTRSGYTFAGWYRESECKTQWTFSNTAIYGDATLYARWVSGQVFTITFDTGSSGWKIDPLYVGEKETVNLYTYYMNQTINIPSDCGYTAWGIYEDAECKTSMLTSENSTKYSVTASKTIYVKMVPAYNVTLDANGGVFTDGNKILVVKIDEKTTLNSRISSALTPKRANSVFYRWTSDAAGTSPVDMDKTPTGSMTLYAQWTVLDSGLSGYWTDGANLVLYLDSNDGKGMYFSRGGYIYEVTLTATSISYGPSEQYTYADNVLTLNGSVKYSRLTTTMSASGNFAPGKYLLNNNFVTVNQNNTVSIRNSSATSDLFTGKWASDETNFYVLNTDNLVLFSCDRNALTELKTTILGGYYYNYPGTEDKKNLDAYSFYLDTDGSCTFWMWNREIKGTWCSTSTDLFLSLGSMGGYQNYTWTEGNSTLTIDRYGTKSNLTKSVTKGTVGAYTEVSALNGTWAASVNGVNLRVTFTADGMMTIVQTQGDQSMTEDCAFVASDGKLYYRLTSDLFSALQGSPYTLSGTTLTFSGVSLTKQ